MALGDFFNRAKEKTAGLFNRFFYDDTMPRDEEAAPDDSRADQTQYAQNAYQQQQPQYAQNAYQQQQPQYAQNAYQQQQPQYAQNAYQQQQPQYAQNAYQQQQPQYAQNAYQQQQPQYAQNAYQQQQPQYAQNAYQQQPQYAQASAQSQQPVQQAQPLYSQFSAQMPQPPRNRRVQQRAQQEAENVVPFPGAYQQDAQQPGTQPQAGETVLNARIINVRGINDCRSAIALLRAGDALIVVMDNVADPAEMRRYVDTLSGACFSLSATITKVSRHGAYLIAPSCVNVYADQMTAQMNGAQRPAAQRYAQGYQPKDRSYQQPYASQEAYAQRPAQDQQGFERRAPAPDVQQNAFYAQRPQNEPAAPSFEAQPAGYGYAPDRMEAVE